jgi:hypothetical protein
LRREEKRRDEIENENRMRFDMHHNTDFDAGGTMKSIRASTHVKMQEMLLSSRAHASENLVGGQHD